MNKDKVLKKNINIVTRVIGEETILLPLYKTSEDLDCIYTLNHIGARIWKLIDGKKTLGRVRTILQREFEVEDDKLDKQLDRFLKDLSEIKAIRR
jgi:hypothetical protein